MGIEIKAILPKKEFRKGAFMERATHDAWATAQGIQEDFEKTVKSWDNEPVFVKKVKITNSAVVITVSTDSQIYRWVTKGTKGPYPIRPKKPGGTLAFNTALGVKTKPRVINSFISNFERPAAMVFTKQVMHPGIKPRKFEEEITKRWKIKFVEKMKTGLKVAVKDCGHAV